MVEGTDDPGGRGCQQQRPRRIGKKGYIINESDPEDISLAGLRWAAK